MRYFRIVNVLLFMIICINFSLDAQVQILNQNNSKQKNEILKELNSNKQNSGDVTVYEDESITHILGRPMGPPRTIYTDAEGSVRYYKMRGYKVQAFSGNNQRTSRDEAYRKQSLINNQFPDLETVVLFESPFWRLRVGNYKSRGEAEEAMRDLKNSFPSFGKEMYVVVDEVKIPVN